MRPEGTQTCNLTRTHSTLIEDKLGGLNTIWTVAAIQTVEVSSEALVLEGTGGWTTTDAVSVDKSVFAAVVYTHVKKKTKTSQLHTHEDEK